MKSQRIIYWVTTGIFSLWMLMNAFGYLCSPRAKILCTHFGFPDYFRVELGVAKLLGAIALLIPFERYGAKEWVYAGFTITLLSGFIAHLASGDTFFAALSALIALAILLGSYLSFHSLKNYSSR